tara:strand:- start:2 stop:304 length:303 start_codon:yes stop_codon:yes gene_type:complete
MRNPNHTSSGVIYILATEGEPGYQIKMTEDIHHTIKHLSKYKTVCHWYYVHEVEDCLKALQGWYSDYRIGKTKRFILDRLQLKTLRSNIKHWKTTHPHAK